MIAGRSSLITSELTLILYSQFVYAYRALMKFLFALTPRGRSISMLALSVV